jgi:hypothetical protein
MEEIIKEILSYFDIRFMIFVFLSAQVFLKYTKLKILKTDYKRLIVILVGVVYAILIAKSDQLLSGLGQSAWFLLNKYGISLFATVLFYDFIYKKIIERLKK